MLMPLFYQQHCAACHGPGRLGMTGPALLPESLARLRKPEAVKVIVAMLPLAMEAVGVVMAMVGAKVSMLMLGVVPVPPVLVPTSA